MDGRLLGLSLFHLFARFRWSDVYGLGRLDARCFVTCVVAGPNNVVRACSSQDHGYALQAHHQAHMSPRQPVCRSASALASVCLHRAVQCCWRLINLVHVCDHCVSRGGRQNA